LTEDALEEWHGRLYQRRQKDPEGEEQHNDDYQWLAGYHSVHGQERFRNYEIACRQIGTVHEDDLFQGSH
jgi:hypothetical protein